MKKIPGKKRQVSIRVYEWHLKKLKKLGISTQSLIDDAVNRVIATQGQAREGGQDSNDNQQDGANLATYTIPKKHTYTIKSNTGCFVLSCNGNPIAKAFKLGKHNILIGWQKYDLETLLFLTNFLSFFTGEDLQESIKKGDVLQVSKITGI